MIVSEQIAIKNLKKHIDKIIDPVFQQAITERNKKTNMSLRTWL